MSDIPRLAACAVGVFEERLGSPANPSGLTGYVFSVATDPAHRRRGHATACLKALLAWFAANGVHRVNLRPRGRPAPVREARLRPAARPLDGHHAAVTGPDAVRAARAIGR